MSDLISRKAAIRIAEQGQIQGFEWQIRKLLGMPSAEPERKKGEWIYDNPNTFKCSKCNKYLDIGCGNMKMNFCPNCGAMMRGEEDED